MAARSGLDLHRQWIRIFTEGWDPIYSCDDCGECDTRTVARVNLDVGNYWVLIEGFEGNVGDYTLEFECLDYYYGEEDGTLADTESICVSTDDERWGVAVPRGTEFPGRCDGDGGYDHSCPDGMEPIIPRSREHWVSFVSYLESVEGEDADSYFQIIPGIYATQYGCGDCCGGHSGNYYNYYGEEAVAMNWQDCNTGDIAATDGRDWCVLPIQLTWRWRK